MVELVLIFLFLYRLIEEYVKNIMTGENMIQSFEVLDLSVFFSSLMKSVQNKFANVFLCFQK